MQESPLPERGMGGQSMGTRKKRWKASMKHGKYYGKIVYYGLVILVMTLAFSAATFAWFTSNSLVSSDVVTSRSGTDTVDLLVSLTDGASFDGSKEVSIAKANANSTDLLMPVSTADLKNFVSNDASEQSMAVHFAKADPKTYYHFKIYLQAKAQNHGPGEQLLLYLDNADESGPLFQNATGNALNAMRLGFLFEGEQPRILRVSEEKNPIGQRSLNTKLNGVALTEKQVIDGAGKTLRAVKDPSAPMLTYMVDADGAVTSNDRQPLLKMDLNRIYTVDVFVYLEGCDPDCTDVIGLKELDFHLAFYGILEENR